MENEKKEVDLFDLIKELFSFIGRVFKQIGAAFLWILRFSIKYYIVFLLSIAIGIGLFFFLRSPKQRLYNMDITVRANVSNSFILSDVVQSLNEIQKISPELLADTLGIPISTVRQIKEIQTFYVIDLNDNDTPDYIDYKEKYKEYDVHNVRMQDRLCVRFITKGYVETKELKSGLVHFLLSNEYLAQEAEMRYKIILGNIQVFDKEIAALDSLRKMEYSHGGQLSLKIENSLMLGERKTYHEEILNLVRRKDFEQSKIILRPGAINIDSPVKVIERYSDIIMLIVLIGGLLFIGFISALFIEYGQQIKKIVKG